MKKRLLIFLISVVLFCFQYGIFPLSAGSHAAPRIIAHRGDSLHAPENTIPAILSAIKNNADCIELDVRCTSDRIPVIFHDSNLKRMTGIDRSVSELHCRDFLSLTLSTEKSDYPTVTPCTLEEVLMLCQKYPQLHLHLELKTDNDEEKVVSLLQKYDSVCSYEISSKNLYTLKKVKLQNPELKTFLLLSSYKDIAQYMFQEPKDIDGISVNASYVTATLSATARKRGHILYAWTVNNRFHMQRLYYLGVDGIITDNPSLLHKMLS